MRFLNRDFLKMTALIGTANATGQALAFLFMIVVAKIMTKEDFGEVRYVLSVATLAATVVAAGLPSSMTRFLAKHNKNKEMQNTYFTNILILFVMFLIITEFGASFIFIDKPIILLVIVGYSIPLIYMGVLRGLMQYKKFSLMSILRNLFKFLFLFILLFFSIVTDIYVLLIYAFGGWAAILVLEAYFSSKINFKSKTISIPIMKEIVSFSIPVFITTFAFSLIIQSPIIILRWFGSYTDIAVYSTAYTITSIYAFVPFAVLTITMPKIASLSKTEDRMKTFTNAVYIIAISGFVLWILTVFIGKWGLFLIFGTKYEASYMPLIILSLGAIFLGIRNSYSALWEGGGRPIFSMYDTLGGGIITLVSAYFLVPYMGVYGASYSFLLGCISAVSISTYFLLKMRKGRIKLR